MSLFSVLLSLLIAFSMADQSAVGNGCGSAASAPGKFEQCNSTVVAAGEQCDKVTKRDNLCGPTPTFEGMDQTKAQNALKDFTAECDRRINEAQQNCNLSAQHAMNVCKAASLAAEADRKAGACKMGEGQDFVNQAVKKERESNKTTPETFGLRERGESRISEGQQQVEDSNNIAGTAKDLEAYAKQIRDSAAREAETQKETIRKSNDVVSRLETAHGTGKPSNDRATGENRGGGSPSKGGGPGGQGQPGDQAGQKKQDEGGGGSPGSGGGSPSNSASSTPLKVSDPPQDCSNPSVAASNPVCACRLNPTDSRCNSILAADKERREGIAKKQQVLSGETEGGGGGFSTGGGGYADPKSPKNISQHGQLQQGPGGSVGKGVGSGQGQGSQGANRNDAKALPYRDHTTAKGGRGGGGGGGGSGFGGGSAQNPNSRIPSTFAATRTGNKGRQPASVKSPADLRAQMQAQFNARRNPTGVVGPDGITGKHTDQFKKIRARYADIMGF